MTDVMLILVVLAFFGLCALYVRLCDRIIAKDAAVPAEDVPERAVR